MKDLRNFIQKMTGLRRPRTQDTTVGRKELQ
jgi:hypothetical protein